MNRPLFCAIAALVAALSISHAARAGEPSPVAGWGVEGAVNEASILVLAGSGSGSFLYRVANQGPTMVTVQFDSTSVTLMPGNTVDGAASRIAIILGTPGLPPGPKASARGTYQFLSAK